MALERLDLFVKYLYFTETMSSYPPETGLATRLAALKGKLAEPASVKLSASHLMGASPPNPVDSHARPFRVAPSPAGSLTLRTAQKQTIESAAILIGASKSQPVPMLEEAITLGLADFGENKVQEAQGKWPELKAAHPHVRLHLIGPLQSNKAADAVALFDVIHTIDRIKIADALAAACQKLGRHPAFLLQVNTGEEPQKAGVAPREVANLLAHCRGLGLNIVGLMCVPPEGVNPAPHFALLKKMADELGLRELSMGMSGDYETALRLGATMIRVGTALFGSRS